MDGVPQWSQLNKDQSGWEKGTESKICWDWSERKWTLSIHSVAGVYEILVDEDDDAHAYEPPLTGWVGQFGGGLEGMPAPLVEDCILIEEVRSLVSVQMHWQLRSLLYTCKIVTTQTF